MKRIMLFLIFLVIMSNMALGWEFQGIKSGMSRDEVSSLSFLKKEFSDKDNFVAYTTTNCPSHYIQAKYIENKLYFIELYFNAGQNEIESIARLNILKKLFKDNQISKDKSNYIVSLMDNEIYLKYVTIKEEEFMEKFKTIKIELK